MILQPFNLGLVIYNISIFVHYCTVGRPILHCPLHDGQGGGGGIKLKNFQGKKHKFSGLPDDLYRMHILSIIFAVSDETAVSRESRLRVKLKRFHFFPEKFPLFFGLFSLFFRPFSRIISEKGRKNTGRRKSRNFSKKSGIF